MMQPVRAAQSWNIPEIESPGALAAWLQLDTNALDWFADLKGLANRIPDTHLTHYRYRFLTKSTGTVRLIESPKQRLKALQRRILTDILDRIPAHPAAHGFVKGRSIRTFATPHVGQRVVLRIDLKDFFPSFTGARIQTFFRTAGYPESVADLLGGLCTNATPRRLCSGTAAELRDLYTNPHLPQGAPTSPALANLCSYRLDCRVSGLAESAGAIYSRYADDLAFSGGDAFARSVKRFSARAAAIVLEEGFTVNFRKTRVMRQGVRQHLAGLVTNQRLNVRRSDFDELKAILTNCVRDGAASQNREAHPMFRAHLDGRISFVESVNAVRGKRLREIFESIRW